MRHVFFPVCFYPIYADEILFLRNSNDSYPRYILIRVKFKRIHFSRLVHIYARKHCEKWMHAKKKLYTVFWMLIIFIWIFVYIDYMYTKLTGARMQSLYCPTQTCVVLYRDPSPNHSSPVGLVIVSFRILIVIRIRTWSSAVSLTIPKLHITGKTMFTLECVPSDKLYKNIVITRHHLQNKQIFRTVSSIPWRCRLWICINNMWW